MSTVTAPRERKLKPRPGTREEVRFTKVRGKKQFQLRWTCGDTFIMGFKAAESFFNKLEKKSKKGENPIVELDKLNPQLRFYVGQIQGRYLVIAARPIHLSKESATAAFNYQALKNTIAKLRED